MWSTNLDGLKGLEQMLLQAIEVAPRGFTFFGVAPGDDLRVVESRVGPPRSSDLESKAADAPQRTVIYQAGLRPVDPNETTVVSVVFVSYNGEPIQSIRLRESYMNTVEHQGFRQAVIKGLAERLGKPEKKSLRRGRETARWIHAQTKLRVWYSDHLYVELTRIG